jgi:hypothetical protein
MRRENKSIGKRQCLRRPFLSFSSFMLAIAVGLISSFTFSAAYDMARSALAPKSQTVAGVWRGHWHGVPAVTIKLEQKMEALSGTASLKKVVATENGARAVGESTEIPLSNPRFDGKRLLFELHSTDGIHPPVFVEMEMRFENGGEAELRLARREAEASAEDKEIIKLRRERSF